MTSEEVKEKYFTVSCLLEESVKKAETIELVGEEENAELSAINSTLRYINNEFKLEIDKLESSSEWNKFCIAFLGETNAGKSTVIESLRIIYDEEQRRIAKEKQEQEYEMALAQHCDRYKNLFIALKNMNELLIEKKEPSKFVVVTQNISFVIFWICVGFTIAYFGF